MAKLGPREGSIHGGPQETRWGGAGSMPPLLPERRDTSVGGRWRRFAYNGKKPETWWRVARVILFLALCGLGYYGWTQREPVGAWLETQIAQATGATVQKIVIEGAGYTPREELQQALALEKGQSLVTYNTGGARARLEALPWVRLAAVERQLPDTLKVSLYEHVPLARVDVDGQYWVANKEGELIVADDEGRFGGLPLLHGLGAPKQAAGLFALLGTWPNLLGQLRDATWVGQRRWDLTFASGVLVRLPEDGGKGEVRAAMARFAELEQQRHVLTLPDGEVDLRLPDRIVLRLPADVGTTPVTDKPAQ